MDSKGQLDTYTELDTIFRVCDNKNISSDNDIQDLYTYIGNGLSYMAMTNYPSNSSFLEPMPAWPVNVGC